MEDVSYLRIGDIVINEDNYISYDDHDGEFVDGCLLKDPPPTYDQFTEGFLSQSPTGTRTGPSKASLTCIVLYVINVSTFGIFGVWSLNGKIPNQTDIWNSHMVSILSPSPSVII